MDSCAACVRLEVPVRVEEVDLRVRGERPPCNACLWNGKGPETGEAGEAGGAGGAGEARTGCAERGEGNHGEVEATGGTPKERQGEVRPSIPAPVPRRHAAE